MFVAAWQRKTLFILIIFPIATRPYTVPSDLERLKEGLARLQKSPYLQNLTSVPSIQLVRLKAMYHDPEYRRAMFEEPKQIGNDCRAPNHYIDAFPCQSFGVPQEPATSVHDLTPADIEVVGALGDSITTGTGARACTVMDAFSQLRGLGFSIGGEGDIVNNPTLANMLRVYNPELVGFSLNEDGFYGYNMATIGATSLNLMSQAQMLVQRMRQELSSSTFLYGWKLVTIHIGINDLCNICNDKLKDKFSLEQYLQRLEEALDYLQENLPRTLVNVIPPVNTGLLPQLRKGLVCTTMHHFICKCGSTLPVANHVDALSRLFQAEVKRLLDSGRYDDDHQFTAVLRPITFNIILPKKPDGSIDLSYFGADCLHFSAKGQAAFAQALWNSMFYPQSCENIDFLTFDEYYNCPSNATHVITTRRNYLPCEGHP